MKKLHIAIATNDIASTVQDYTQRLDSAPCVVVPNEYALWRTHTLNFSVRQDSTCKPGELRHLGWEDPAATCFTAESDVNGILWENFAVEHQVQEIEAAWPGTAYSPDQ